MEPIKEMDIPQGPPLVITSFDTRFPVLEQKSLPCGIPLSPEDASIVTRMKDELVNLGEEAVGLAGIQIGLARQIFVMKTSDEFIIECINPVILFRSKEISRKAEGCLSLPKMMTMIKRPKMIRLQYFDRMGMEHIREFRGLEAKIVAHEMDHLNGRMISHYVTLEIDKNERMREERFQSLEKKKVRRRKMAKLHKRNNRR